jgi:sugar-specific transcriptional regulator TrmB
MDKNKYIKKLVEVGLLPREARIYFALLSKNSFTATEIAKVSGIPRQKIYEILDNIIKKGICVEKVGKVKQYKAMEPESVLRGLIEKYKEKEKLALKLSDDLSALYEKNREQIDPLEYIEVFKNKGQIRRRWFELQKNAKQEILAFTKAPYTISLSENIDEESNTIKRGVTIKSIYEYKDVIYEDLVSVISSWVFAGEKARIVKELPIKLAIFDEKITMLALNDPVSLKPTITTIIINHPSFAKAQRYVFESIWEKAMPFEEFKIKGM